MSLAPSYTWWPAVRRAPIAAISAEGLSKHYGSVKALDNLNLEVPENVVFGFLGPNGAGKTTTVKLLTGFARPTAGRAWVAGESVGDGGLGLQTKIGLLPDVPAFYDWMSGREFLHMVGELHHLRRPEIRRRTEDLLDLVDLGKAGNRRVGGYSRGMRQRLGIAQALINRPRVLFMDEPTSALDPIGRREVLALITHLRESATIFMSTHILSDVDRVCDLVGIIDKGILVTVSSVEDLQRKYARSVFEMEFMEDAAPFVESLKSVSWLAEPEVVLRNGTPVVLVKAVDVDHARRELPRLISESGLTLTHYELALPSIEDIFVEIFTGSQPR
jgi:ABC-2 type transport system ATP-binding protein